MKTCVPITQTQQETFEAFDKGDNLLLHGLAGTGKTFISMYLALREVLEGHNYKQVIVIRSVVPTRDIGFLPGNAKEKSKIYEGPYYAICNELFGRGDAYDILKSKNTIDFMTTSFLRGTTLNNAIIIVDEVNNMTLHELDSVITRLGKNCRIVFCGDFRQSDLLKESERRGLMEFMTILQNMRSFSHIEFTQEDIVRSGLVKQYIITKDRLGIHT
jgi:phosphate starvation-inducible protein PhoH